VPLKDIKILATDIDNEAIKKAKAGIYTEKSVEKLPAQYLAKYFRREGNSYIINDDVKACVEFRRINLLKDPYPQNCDLIVCRNVLIYFTEEAKDEIYRKINKALKNEGVLFIGSTEQIIMSGKYSLKPVKTFFYIKEGEIRYEPAREQNNLSC
jgi:chemotaxis protein methyltransferase CheR